MEAEDDPYIDRPDVLNDDAERNGLVCFLNADRACGPDCMAYVTFPSESLLMSEQQKHCIVLVSTERLARFTGGILSQMRKGQEDAQRGGTKSPPDPMGGR